MHQPQEGENQHDHEARVDRAIEELNDALITLSRNRDTTFLITRVRPQVSRWAHEIDDLLTARAARGELYRKNHCPHCGRQLQRNGECRIGCV